MVAHKALGIKTSGFVLDNQNFLRGDSSLNRMFGEQNFPKVQNQQDELLQDETGVNFNG